MPKVGEVKKGVPSPTVRRTSTRLAINLFDLDRMLPMMRQTMLGGRLDLKVAVWVDKDRLDESAVVFTCDLLEAAALCDVIRDHDRSVGDYPTRVYLCRESAWQRVPADAILSIVVEGKCDLNPKHFPKDVEPAEAIPLEPKPVF